MLSYKGQNDRQRWLCETQQHKRIQEKRLHTFGRNTNNQLGHVFHFRIQYRYNKQILKLIINARHRPKRFRNNRYFCTTTTVILSAASFIEHNVSRLQLYRVERHTRYTM